VKKGIIFILLIVFLVFFSTGIVSAYSSFGNVFGGRIINTKAVEIAGLEAVGYICPMFGTSISIIPMGSPISTPSSYFIPSYVVSKTRTTPTIGQLILGKYSGRTMISCMFPYPPSTIAVSLDTITLFGTSRF